MSNQKVPAPATAVVKYDSFKKFYPFYLSEHSHPTNRTIHFIGTSIVILWALYLVLSQQWTLLWTLPIPGYAMAWIGHFIFEKNRPATFKYPLYSLAGDFKMWFDLITGKLRFRPDPKMGWAPN